MHRVYNFSAGPSQLPEPVLSQCASEMLDFRSTGQSVLEMSHRSKAYQGIIDACEVSVRALMDVPDNYKVLFLQGGASLQFAMLAQNLASLGRAAYVDTGIWAEKAIQEARKYLEVDVIASSKDKNYQYIPDVPKVSGDYDYVHITLNNTIFGTKWANLPDTGDLPLVADVSSCILSEPLDVSRFGLLYAGAQKNIGPAGVTLVIIREDLIRTDLDPKIPTMLRYDTHAQNGSMYNTPPTYAIYVMSLVLDWIQRLGGADAIGKLNQAKAQLFYRYLDASDVYAGTVEVDSRSLMNIPFVFRKKSGDEAVALNKAFVAAAEKKGLVNLAGHRLVGGMRASIYNAMPIEGVQALISFMDDFANTMKGSN